MTKDNFEFSNELIKTEEFYQDKSDFNKFEKVYYNKTEYNLNQKYPSSNYVPNDYFGDVTNYRNNNNDDLTPDNESLRTDTTAGTFSTIQDFSIDNSIIEAFFFPIENSKKNIKDNKAIEELVTNFQISDKNRYRISMTLHYQRKLREMNQENEDRLIEQEIEEWVNSQLWESSESDRCSDYDDFNL
ncbi:hypothetical protein G9A89_002181 [Geosiphon pyriformis]|nr:hypothetical protein G9A89_002181 [Geosiphon pyriformis]